MTARFATNEICRRDHHGCGEMEMMHFPPVHFASTICVSCAIEVFRENGEFTRWLVTIQVIVDEDPQGMRPGDEWYFWREWLADLKAAAFYNPSEQRNCVVCGEPYPCLVPGHH